MIHVIKNNYNAKEYYKHRCDYCKSVLLFENSDTCYTLDTDILCKTVKCPLCKKMSYMNDFVSVSEAEYKKCINAKKPQ